MQTLLLLNHSPTPTNGAEWEERVWNTIYWHFKAGDIAPSCRALMVNAPAGMTIQTLSGFLSKLVKRGQLSTDKYRDMQSSSTKDVLHYMPAVETYVPATRQRNVKPRKQFPQFNFDQVDKPIQLIVGGRRAGRATAAKQESEAYKIMEGMTFGVARVLYQKLHLIFKDAS